MLDKLNSAHPAAAAWVLDKSVVFSFSSAIKFDAAKEERYQQEAKQRELQRIEEALQMAARRGETD